jgi:peptidoglycan hydrolase CwlO-like protein
MALAAQNTIFDNVAEAMFRYSCDRDVLEQCRKIDDSQKYTAYLEESNKTLTAEVKSLRANKAKMGNQISEQKSQITEQKSQIAELEARVAYLEAHQK